MAVSAASSSSAAQQIVMPRHNQLEQLYASIAQGAMKDGSAKRLAGPPVANAEKYAGYDATPARERGVGWKVYAINMHLYLATTPVTAGKAKTTWYDVGPMPMFQAKF